MIPPGTRWEDFAVCRQYDPDLFFPEKSHHGKTSKAKQEQVIISVACRVCPVRERCLDYALSLPDPQYGVWGGLTERELGDARRALGKRYGYAINRKARKNSDEQAA